MSTFKELKHCLIDKLLHSIFENVLAINKLRMQRVNPFLTVAQQLYNSPGFIFFV